MINTNTAPVAKLAISDRVSLPASVKRSESKNLIAALFGSPASAFGTVSVTARRDDFVSKCAALALASMIHGDSSRLERIERYASTLPEYKKTKSGEITGAIGKLILAYREACTIGDKARLHADFDISADVIDIERWLINSASFGGIIEAPKRAPKAIARPVPVPAPDTAPETADTAPETAKPLLVPWSGTDGSINPDADPAAEVAANNAMDAQYAQAKAVEVARQEGERAALARLTAQGEGTVRQVFAFCDLANKLGITLTKAQLAQLDKLEAVAKAA